MLAPREISQQPTTYINLWHPELSLVEPVILTFLLQLNSLFSVSILMG